MSNQLQRTRLAALVCGVALFTSVHAAGMEDPLRPPEYAPGAHVSGVKRSIEQAWHVNEILFSGARRVAIVNDMAVAIGDRVDGAKVLGIEPAHVTLMYKNKTITARLKAMTIKTKSISNIN